MNADPAATVVALPKAPGAYALLLRLDRPATLSIKGNDRRLAPGLYVYAGSARGPGGIRARVARHLRRPKPTHWHIDRLTAVAESVGVVAWPSGDECSLVAGLAGLKAATDIEIPAPGFGSSDCRTCPAHLMRLADEQTGAALDRVANVIQLAFPGAGAIEKVRIDHTPSKAMS